MFNTSYGTMLKPLNFHSPPKCQRLLLSHNEARNMITIEPDNNNIDWKYMQIKKKIYVTSPFQV